MCVEEPYINIRVLTFVYIMFVEHDAFLYVVLSVSVLFSCL